MAASTKVPDARYWFLANPYPLTVSTSFHSPYLRTVAHPSMAKLIIDDGHPSIIYEGSWVPGGTPFEEYNSTTHGTFSNDTHATFSFQGLSVSVFGTIGPKVTDSPAVSYSINGSGGILHHTAGDGAVHYKQLFYQSPLLDPSIRHTLVIEVQNIRDDTFWLDYLEVEEGTTTSPAPLPSQTSQSDVSTSSALSPMPVATRETRTQSLSDTQSSFSTQTPPLLSCIQTQSPTTQRSTSIIQLSTTQPSTTQPAEDQDSLSRSNIAGTVAASVLGCILFIIIIAAGLFLVLRRRKKAKAEGPSHPHPHPFLLTPEYSGVTNPPESTLGSISSSIGNMSGACTGEPTDEKIPSYGEQIDFNYPSAV